jgi:UDP-N-acetylglucosamine:LPS N-acetylglucosamine transferase
VTVIHDGKLSKDPAFYQFDWDAVVCFDERYKKFLSSAYDPDKIHLIPYPCHPLLKGDKQEKRVKLGLPDKKIILFFGHSSKTCAELVPSIAKLSSQYPILILVVTKDKKGINEFKKLQSEIIEIREEAPSIKKLYDYLHASDVLVLNKKSSSQVVVSSTVFQCLGSGCPIVAFDSNYVECFENEVMKYSTPEELSEKIRSIFDETKEYKNMMKTAEDYVKKNSAHIIGKKYIELFNSLEDKC